MICKNCGHLLSGTDRFCPNCGEKVMIDLSQIASETANGAQAGGLGEATRNTGETTIPPVAHTEEKPKREFHFEEIDWNLDGYPTENKPSTDEVDFDWESVIDNHGAPKMPEEKPENAEALQKIRPEVKEEEPAPAVEEIAEEVAVETSVPPQPTQEETAQSIEEMIFGTKDRHGDISQTMRIDEGDDLSQTTKMDKFYTYNKKNEEFQELLDREYNRLKDQIDYRAEEPAPAEPVTVENREEVVTAPAGAAFAMPNFERPEESFADIQAQFEQGQQGVEEELPEEANFGALFEQAEAPAFEPAAEPAVETPEFEAPAFEAPAFEAPAAEAPIFEEPAVEEAAFVAPAFEPAFEPAPVFEEPAATQPEGLFQEFQAGAVEQEPVAEAPIFEEPAFTPQEPVFAPAEEAPVNNFASLFEQAETPAQEAFVPQQESFFGGQTAVETPEEVEIPAFMQAEAPAPVQEPVAFEPAQDAFVAPEPVAPVQDAFVAPEPVAPVQDAFVPQQAFTQEPVEVQPQFVGVEFAQTPENVFTFETAQQPVQEAFVEQPAFVEQEPVAPVQDAFVPQNGVVSQPVEAAQDNASVIEQMILEDTKNSPTDKKITFQDVFKDELAAEKAAKERKPKKHTGLKIMAIILCILIVLEIIVITIKYAAPESAAALKLQDIFNGVYNGISGLFGG